MEHRVSSGLSRDTKMFDTDVVPEAIQVVEVRNENSNSDSMSDINDVVDLRGIEPLNPKSDSPTSLKTEVKGAIQYTKSASKRWWNDEFGGYGYLDWFGVFLPCTRWLRTYPWASFFLNDMVAGLSVGLLLIPQSMSYAGLAGLPYQYGLYAGFMPVVVYKLFGSSPQLAVGPVAIISLMLGTGLQNITGYSSVDPNRPDNPQMQAEYNMLALQVSMLVGVFEFLMGFFRLGFLTNFLSHSVISGFTTGSAITIAMQQIKDMTGIKAPRATNLQDVVSSLISNVSTFSWKTFVFSLACMAILVGFKEIGARVKKLSMVGYLGPMTVTTMGIVLSYALDFKARGISVVGPFPGGLPHLDLDSYVLQDKYPIQKIISTVGLVALVGVMESISIAKALAEKNHYTFSPDQDLRALGLGNFIGAGFGGYAATGSFSRSSLADATGCKTQMSGLATSVLMMVVLLVATKPFHYLPKAAMACIIAFSVMGLVDIASAIHSWKVSKKDFLVWVTSFIVTLFAGAELGLGVSIGLHILLTVVESAFPYTSVLGRVPETTIYRDTKRYEGALVVPGVLIFRVDAPIYFANVQYIDQRIKKVIARDEAHTGTKVRYLVLDMQPVTHVDATAIRQLLRTLDSLKYEGVRVVLAGTTRNTLQLLLRGGLIDVVGREWVFMQVYEAVLACIKLDNGGVHSERDVLGAALTPVESKWQNGPVSPRFVPTEMTVDITGTPSSLDGAESAEPFQGRADC